MVLHKNDQFVLEAYIQLVTHHSKDELKLQFIGQRRSLESVGGRDEDDYFRIHLYLANDEGKQKLAQLYIDYRHESILLAVQLKFI
jgi:hypothetical protein